MNTGACANPRSSAGPWLVGLLALLLAGCAASLPADRRSLAASAGFTATLHVDGGLIALQFEAPAAPRAVAALRRTFEAGAWNGVAFDWIRPHIEIRSGAPGPSKLTIPSELDAVALGLDRQRIADVGAAMNLLQMELEPALLRSGGDASPQLQDWVRQWRADFKADFLVGVSQQAINEALGYRYQRGFASKPVRRGSLALLPTRPGESSLALAIVLSDQPARDGRWVVVGRVSAGLELAERLSLAERTHPKFYAPLRPARISSVEIASNQLP